MLSLLTLMIWINMTQNPNSQKFYCPVIKNGKKIGKEKPLLVSVYSDSVATEIIIRIVRHNWS